MTPLPAAVFKKDRRFTASVFAIAYLSFLRRPPILAARSQASIHPQAEHSELAHRLSEIEGLDIPDGALDRRPSFKISLLNRESELTKFFAAMEWLIAEVKSHSS